MAIKIFHLELKDKDFHGYYTTLTALHNDQGPAIGKSLSTLQKHNFEKPWTNPGTFSTIRRGEVVNSKEIYSKRKKR